MINSIKALCALIIILSMPASYLYGRHEQFQLDEAARLKAINEIQAKDYVVAQAIQSEADKYQQQITALQTKLNQPPKERIVYVTVNGKSQEVTSPVYITNGSWWLYNDTLGLLPNGSGSDKTLYALQSNVTVSQYQQITTENNVACLSNKQNLDLLWEWVDSLPKTKPD